MASSIKARKHRSVVGLDIDPGYLAAAEVVVNGRLAVQHAATAPLPPGVMRDGEVVDGEVLAEALKDFFGAHKLPKRVRIGVANQRIVVRTIDLPKIEDPKDLDAAVRFQAQEHIPMPLEQAVLDFQSQGFVTTDQGERTRIVLVAARRDMIERLLAAARAAGLRPEGIDLAAFAMVRSLGDTAPGGAEVGSVLYINVGGLTNVAVADGGECRFTRVISGGLETMAGGLAERRGLTLEHSHQWLAHVGLQAPLDMVEGDDAIVADARAELADGVRRIADEVRNSIDYYRTQEMALGAERAVVTGAGVAIPGFPEQLSTDLGMPVEPRVVAEATPGAFGDVEPGRMTVAAGLAVEEIGS
jgi:type IV pilus assembly protein PilM